MSKRLPVFAAFLLAVAYALCVAPVHADVTSPSPAPTASPEPTIPINGVDVSARDFATLFADVVGIYLPIKDAPVSGVLVNKEPSDMPSADPDWYYAGTQTLDGKPQITVWISKALKGDNAILAMQTAAALGLLDDGIGGSQLQAMYAKAKDADAAAGPTAKDPWQHRKVLASDLATLFMAIMSKK